MKMIPGMNKMKGMDKLNMDEKQIDYIKAIIQSMTPRKRKPSSTKCFKKKRIAKGSGRSLQEVNRLMKQFNDMKKMMKQFSGAGRKGKKGKRSQMENMLKGMNLPF